MRTLGPRGLSVVSQHLITKAISHDRIEDAGRGG